MRNMRERSRVQYQRAQRKVTNYETRDRNIIQNHNHETKFRPKKSQNQKTKSINFFDAIPMTSSSPLSPVNDDLIYALETIEFNKIEHRIMALTRAKPHLWKICFID